MMDILKLNAQIEQVNKQELQQKYRSESSKEHLHTLLERYANTYGISMNFNSMTDVKEFLQAEKARVQEQEQKEIEISQKALDLYQKHDLQGIADLLGVELVVDNSFDLSVNAAKEEDAMAAPIVAKPKKASVKEVKSTPVTEVKVTKDSKPVAPIPTTNGKPLSIKGTVVKQVTTEYDEFDMDEFDADSFDDSEYDMPVSTTTDASTKKQGNDLPKTTLKTNDADDSDWDGEDLDMSDLLSMDSDEDVVPILPEKPTPVIADEDEDDGEDW
jgi:hypothetical protein